MRAGVYTYPQIYIHLYSYIDLHIQLKDSLNLRVTIFVADVIYATNIVTPDLAYLAQRNGHGASPASHRNLAYHIS